MSPIFTLILALVLVSINSWGEYLAEQVVHRGFFRAFSLNSCLPLIKTTLWEQRGWTKTVKVQVRQLKNELQVAIKLPKAEGSCTFSCWWFSVGSSLRATPFTLLTDCHLMYCYYENVNLRNNIPFLCCLSITCKLCGKQLTLLASKLCTHTHTHDGEWPEASQRFTSRYCYLNPCWCFQPSWQTSWFTVLVLVCEITSQIVFCRKTSAEESLCVCFNWKMYPLEK